MVSDGKVRRDNLWTIVSSVSAWCSVLCVLVDNVDTMPITATGGLRKVAQMSNMCGDMGIDATDGVLTIALVTTLIIYR